MIYRSFLNTVYILMFRRGDRWCFCVVFCDFYRVFFLYFIVVTVVFVLCQIYPLIPCEVRSLENKRYWSFISVAASFFATSLIINDLTGLSSFAFFSFLLNVISRCRLCTSAYLQSTLFLKIQSSKLPCSGCLNVCNLQIQFAMIIQNITYITGKKHIVDQQEFLSKSS